jgi:prepilin-type processing-associated H-X9-DG protein
LIIYSLDTETSRVVHEYDASKSVISLPQFVGKSGMVAFVEQLEDGASRLALVEPGGRKLSRVVSTSHVQLVCSSLRSEVILQTENEFWLLDSQLEVRKKFPRIGNLIGYGPKEESLEYFVISAPVSPSKQSSITPGLIDIKTGKMREISIAERNALNQAASDASPHLDEFDGVAIVSSAISPILKDAMAVLAVVENRPVLIAGDGRNPMVNADHTAVSYVTKAGVMVRPIVEVPIELYENGITAAERAKILSEAKQCALAYIIYAADYDNVVPGADSNWSKLLGPYLKNDSLLNGFVITFNGGNLGDVSSPAETVMGYKLGPGGRAVAYLDGHVKWQKN